MPATIALAFHVLATKVMLCGEGVVSLAAQAQIFEAVRAPARERLEVMELETLGLAAADTALVDVGASAFIPLEDSAADACSDVSAAPARCYRLSARS